MQQYSTVQVSVNSAPFSHQMALYKEFSIVINEGWDYKKSNYI